MHESTSGQEARMKELGVIACADSAVASPLLWVLVKRSATSELAKQEIVQVRSCGNTSLLDGILNGTVSETEAFKKPYQAAVAELSRTQRPSRPSAFSVRRHHGT